MHTIRARNLCHDVDHGDVDVGGMLGTSAAPDIAGGVVSGALSPATVVVTEGNTGAAALMTGGASVAAGTGTVSVASWSMMLFGP